VPPANCCMHGVEGLGIAGQRPTSRPPAPREEADCHRVARPLPRGSAPARRERHLGRSPPTSSSRWHGHRGPGQDGHPFGAASPALHQSAPSSGCHSAHRNERRLGGNSSRAR
jgi:hypothetical protein